MIGINLIDKRGMGGVGGDRYGGLERGVESIRWVREGWRIKGWINWRDVENKYRGSDQVRINVVDL